MDITLKNEQFEKFLIDYFEKEKVMGSIILSYQGKPIFKKHLGYQDIENNVPISDKTRFRFYSLTKPLVATGIMLLYERGIVDIYAPLYKTLDIAKNLDKRITVLDLLHHTSGLPEIASALTLSYNDTVNFDKEIKSLEGQPLDFDPSTKYFYRNTNYILLSLIIEKYSDEKLDKFLTENVLKPLGMDTVVFEYNDTEIPNKSQGYEYDEKGNLIKGEWVNMHRIFGAGFAVGRISDFYKFYEAVREKKLLKEETWKLVFTRAKAGRFGIGCMVLNYNDTICYQHTGGHIGFRNIHRYFPNEDFDMLMLCNVANNNVREEVLRKAYEIYLEKEDNMKNIEMDKGFATK
ncbi:MAG: beta-lactamase family protein [Clostridia bacterium]|nr:beta-lactamase family protein [Clostridia bacterium]